MIQLLNTIEINSEIKKMFEEEKEHLIIVSPYVWEDKELEKLKDADKLSELDKLKNMESLLSFSSAKIDFLVREPEKPNDISKLKSIEDKIKNVKFKKIKNLHAKAYISKKYSIITSANFTIHSQTDNPELGIMFNNSVYSELYEKLINEINVMLKANNHDMITDKIKSHRLINKVKRLFQ